MAGKKKEEIDIRGLNTKTTLEEAVACSILGRAIASYGSTLTGTERSYAKLVYYLLKARRKFSDKWPVTAQISKEKKVKKPSPTEAITWFVNKYPKRAQPLLNKLKGKYDKTETSVLYGLREGEDLSDDFYVDTLKTFLKIPEDEAEDLYYKVFKPARIRQEEKKGLTGLVIK
ncbi:MAG: hypothetical protein NTZ83_00855 [Candidatus Pacearchaeota archaeon]|nr:hypothetical protein [Candidatus Pacearchaeota archaeon]